MIISMTNNAISIGVDNPTTKLVVEDGCDIFSAPFSMKLKIVLSDTFVDV